MTSNSNSFSNSFSNSSSIPTAIAISTAPSGSRTIEEVEEEEDDDASFLSRIQFRKASPTDILRCVEMKKLLFASRNDLEYRQHFAANYYRCAVYQDDDQENDEDNIIGFVTGIRLGGKGTATTTRRRTRTMQRPGHSPKPSRKVLFIRSVIVGAEYRNKGVGKAMIRDYIETVRQQRQQKRTPISKIVGLCSDTSLLPFCMACGFSVRRADTVATRSKSKAKSNAKAYFLELELAAPNESTSCYYYDADDETVRCYIVDSFASAPGTGNPASVVLLRDDFDPGLHHNHKWMQKVAAEFNLAETAFCWPTRGGRRNNHLGGGGGSNHHHHHDDNNSNHSASNCAAADADADAIAFFKNESHWNIRYFTPTVEMGLCGHATLASAAVLYQTLPSEVLPPGTAVVFHASEDILTMNLADDVTKKSQSQSSQSQSKQRVSKVSMDFPPKPTKEISTREEKATVRNMLKSAFSVELEPLYVGLSDIGDLLVELSPKTFGEIGYDSLNFKALCEWDGYYRGIVVCCVPPESDKNKSSSRNSNNNNNNKVDNNDDDDEERAGVKIDFLSRFFAPKAGINEDPVTGSAHCSLGPYFAKKLGKQTVVGRQMSVRSGIVECEVAPDRVTLTGTAITTMSGTLYM
eukprot:jgi/Psemu1/261294/estExt_Genewise1Plus.C_5610001